MIKKHWNIKVNHINIEMQFLLRTCIPSIQCKNWILKTKLHLKQAETVKINILNKRFNVYQKNQIRGTFKRQRQFLNIPIFSTIRVCCVTIHFFKNLQELYPLWSTKSSQKSTKNLLICETWILWAIYIFYNISICKGERTIL